MHIITMLMKCFSKTLQCNTGVLHDERTDLVWARAQRKLRASSRWKLRVQGSTLLFTSFGAEESSYGAAAAAVLERKS